MTRPVTITRDELARRRQAASLPPDPDAANLFRLELRPEPGCTAPAMVRLRTLLKVLLRAYGFRVVRVKVVTSEQRNQEALTSARRGEVVRGRSGG